MTDCKRQVSKFKNFRQLISAFTMCRLWSVATVTTIRRNLIVCVNSLGFLSHQYSGIKRTQTEWRRRQKYYTLRTFHDML